jgi:hypothetical protein
MDRHPSCKTIFAIHILKWIVDSISQFVLYQLMTSDSSNLVFFFGGSTFATAIAFNHVFVCKMFNVFKKVYQNRQLSSG